MFYFCSWIINCIKNKPGLFSFFAENRTVNMPWLYGMTYLWNSSCQVLVLNMTSIDISGFFFDGRHRTKLSAHGGYPSSSNRAQYTLSVQCMWFDGKFQSPEKLIDVSTVSLGEAANDTRFKTGYLKPLVRHIKSGLIIYKKTNMCPVILRA